MKHLPIKHGIDLAPMVDIVFLLLATFLLSATMGRQAVLDLQLPPATTGHQGGERSIELRIDAEGRVKLDGKPVDQKSLRETLRSVAAAGEFSRRRVRIAADARAPYGSVMVVFDALRSVGLAQIELVAESP